jgi:hypothetical protein
VPSYAKFAYLSEQCNYFNTGKDSNINIKIILPLDKEKLARRKKKLNSL